MNSPHQHPADLLADLDPVDPGALAAAWANEGPPPPQELFAGLDAPTCDPLHPRRHWGRAAVVGGAAAASIAACLVVVGTPGSTPSASATCQLQDGKIVIDWMANPHGGRAVINDLRACGLDITITEELRASPSLVGTVSGNSPVGGPNDTHPNVLPPGISIGAEGTPQAFTWTIDPAIFESPLTARLYVATPPGQAYQSSESVFSRGEPLDAARCDLTTPLLPEQAAELAESAGLRVQWTIDTPTAFDTNGDWAAATSHVSDKMPEGVVYQDAQINDHVVDFKVRPAGEWPTKIRESDASYLANLQKGC